jgi:hypothetical protein
VGAPRGPTILLGRLLVRFVVVREVTYVGVR